MKTIIDHLKEFLAEEEKANLEYSGAISCARKGGDQVTATLLNTILLDEQKHAKLLRKRLGELKA